MSWAEAPSPPQPDLLAAAFRWLEYLGLLGAVGCLVVGRLGRQPPRIPWVEPPIAIALAAATIGGAGVTVVAPSAPAALRVIVELLAFACQVRRIPVVAPLTVLAGVLLAPAGHAAGLGPGAAGAVFVDAVHVLAAGAWAGGVLALAALHPPDGWRTAQARELVERFSRIAVVAFAATALTGVLRAVGQLTDPTQLWTTHYGAVLVLKSAGVVVMAVLSLLWRRGWPASRLEAAAAIAVTGTTALLASFPLPVN